MNREVIATGRTVDEALDKAYEQLGISRDEAQFEILDLPKKGFLGLGASPAKVRVFIEVSKGYRRTQILAGRAGDPRRVRGHGRAVGWVGLRGRQRL